MEFIGNLILSALTVYGLILATIILLAVIFYAYIKYKVRKKTKESLSKVYKYKSYNMKLVRNTLAVKKALFFLLKQDFRKAIEKENEALGFEYVKPFDFTKLREQDVTAQDLMGAIVIICEDKEICKQILKLFISDSEKYSFDFEKDFSELSEIAIDVLNDFFLENAGKMHS